jgi:hypothetical protein
MTNRNHSGRPDEGNVQENGGGRIRGQGETQYTLPERLVPQKNENKKQVRHMPRKKEKSI